MPKTKNHVMAFRWEIPNFKTKDMSLKLAEESFSDKFFLNTPSNDFQFKLWLKTAEYFSQYSFGIVFESIESPLDIAFKLWLQNEDGQRFYEHSVKNHVFNKTNRRHSVGIVKDSQNYPLFEKVWSENETLYICCQFVKPKECNALSDSENLVQNKPNDCDASLDSENFVQNHWSLYESGIHDAIIEVKGEGIQFKVLKCFFTCQSEYFKEKFSTNSTIEIGNFGEEIVMAMIKWMYTGRIENFTLVDKLFVVANEFDIKLLKKTCAKLMVDDLKKENTFTYLILAVLHNNEMLKNASMLYIDDLSKLDLVNCFVSPAWNQLCKKSVLASQIVLGLIREKLSEGEVKNKN